MSNYITDVNFNEKNANAVLEIILRLSKKYGYVYGGHQEIARQLRRSIATIGRAIRYLRENNLIKLTSRYHTTSLIHPNYNKIASLLNNLKLIKRLFPHSWFKKQLPTEPVDKSVDNMLTTCETAKVDRSKCTSIYTNSPIFIDRLIYTDRTTTNNLGLTATDSQKVNKSTAPLEKPKNLLARARELMGLQKGSGRYQTPDYDVYRRFGDYVETITQFYNDQVKKMFDIDEKLTYDSAEKVTRRYRQSGLSIDQALRRIFNVFVMVKNGTKDIQHISMEHIFP